MITSTAMSQSSRVCEQHYRSTFRRCGFVSATWMATTIAAGRRRGPSRARRRRSITAPRRNDTPLRVYRSCGAAVRSCQRRHPEAKHRRLTSDGSGRIRGNRGIGAGGGRQRSRHCDVQPLRPPCQRSDIGSWLRTACCVPLGIRPVNRVGNRIAMRASGTCSALAVAAYSQQRITNGNCPPVSTGCTIQGVRAATREPHFIPSAIHKWSC